MTTTATAHTNIAFIKYWGKKDPVLNLPTTSSLSLTLDKFYTQTTVSPSVRDQLTINGIDQPVDRVRQFLDILRQELGYFPPMQVESNNQVPTSAGLASSASAFAALTAAVVKEAGHDLSLTELSRLARRGSGSATRSFFPDFAVWQAGDDNATSYAYHLDVPRLPLALVVVELADTTKKVSSSDGMQRAMTSPYYANWVQDSKKELPEMEAALAKGDLDQVGALAEKNALGMHELNLTAKDQRFTYFTPQTLQVIHLVQGMRKQGMLAYATIDAGPNVKIITSDDQAPAVMEQVQGTLPKARLTVAHGGPGLHYD
ncbi:diphosphomevalonate decarboxylase [Lactobacillaceae bacterium L1_55_11]|nr:diphosphomevalonate decarboxylase [Lactobacillaceae bacterium L1_55_11]